MEDSTASIASVSSYWHSVLVGHTSVFFSPNFYGITSIFKAYLFLTGPVEDGPSAKDHIFPSSLLFPLSPGDLYWIGSDKSCSALIGRHKFGLVQMHV